MTTMMTKLKPWHKLTPLHTIPRTGLKEIGTNPGTKGELYLKQPRWRWSDHHITDFKMTVRTDHAVLLPPSAYTILKLPFKSPCPLSSNRGWGVGLWTGICPPPCPPVAGSRNKATFPFLPTLVSRELAFKLWAAGPEFGNNATSNFL